MNETEVSSVNSVKKCPICGGELERGYVIAYKWLWWDTERHTFRGGELLSKNPAWNTNFPALRCRKCHIIAFDYERTE